ncbi:hypothetical protein HMPREF1977_0344 [Capnocytophaga ochracea F0287]|uniref:Uncharacterized protein n=1 Tax=Capnocytophaga ochracea F0287 TaxID=873517 RepID=E4MPN4_CAPOC|nr:hypothetical protein [Capnocytophaga ochracea]EFS98348.1 hypothetical protein HMPREF1977_0344 [Capnocytophaga ochracea F0287]EJF45696.1 hypothetical protein HMPREF1319_1348 [Capnocytophaga ochracea str. Holt 25]UEB43382.1 hypothetical protein LK419_11410 [Capnocytophaga ochracea]
MGEIKEIYIKRWDYILYEIDDKKILTVMFFASYIDYPRSFYLEGSELNLNYDELSVLAERIRFNYDDFKNREIIPPIMK